MIDIETGIPVPTIRHSRSLGEIGTALRALSVSQSAFIPGRHSRNIGGYAAHLKPKKFTFRSAEKNGVKGVRVWRIE
jgi:hypothetical protein